MYLRVIAMMAALMVALPAQAATDNLDGHQRNISHMAVSADGKRAITRDHGHGIIFWDLTKKVALQTYKKRHWLRVLAISPRGERAISAGPQSKSVFLYQHSRKDVQVLPKKIKWLQKAAFVGPQKLVLLGLREKVLVDLTGKVLLTLPKARFSAVASTPDGSLFALAAPKHIVFYDGKTHKELATIPSPTKITTLTFGPKGAQLAAGGKDGEIRLYAPDKSGKWSLKRNLFGHRGPIDSVAFVNQNTLVSERKWFIQWDLRTGRSTTILRTGWKTRTTSAGGGKLIYPKGKSLILQSPLTAPKKAPPQHGKSVYIKGEPTAHLWLPPKLFPARIPTLDGTIYQLVVGDQNGRVHLLQIHFGLNITIQRSALGKVDGPVTSLALNTRTKQIAIANSRSGKVDLWQLHSNKRSRHKLLPRSIQSVAFTADGNNLIAGNRLGQIVVFDCRKKTLTRQVYGHTKLSRLRVLGRKESFLFAEESKYKPVTLSGLADDTVYQRMSRYSSAPFAEAHKLGRWAIVGAWKNMVLHDLQTQKRRSISMLTNGQSGALDPGLRFAAASLKKSGKVHIYGLVSGKVIQRYQVQWSGLRTLSISSDGRALMGFRGHRVWLLPLGNPPKAALDMTPLKKPKPWSNTKGTFMGRTKGTIYSLAYHPKKKTTYAAGYFGYIAAMKAGKQPESLLGAWGAKYAVALSPDGKWLVTGGKRSGRMSIGNLLTKRAKDISLKERLRCLAFSRDGKQLAVGSTRGKVFVYNTKDWTLTHTLRHSSSKINGVAFHPEGQILASSSDDNTLVTWDLTTQKRRWRHRGNDDINDLQYSPDGNELAAINEDGMVLLFNEHGVAKEYKFGNTMLDGYALAYRPDGRLIAAGFEDGILGIIDRKSGKITRLKVNWNDISALTWTDRGELLVAYTSAVYRIQLPKDMPKYIPPVRTKGPFAPLHRAKAGQSYFHPQAGLLLLARKGTIEIYHQASGKRSAALSRPPAIVAGITASKAADWIAAWSQTKLVLWERKSKKRYNIPTQGKIAAVSFHGVFLALHYQDKSTQLFRYDPKRSTTPAKPAAKAPTPRREPAKRPAPRKVTPTKVIPRKAAPQKPAARRAAPAVRKPATKKPAARRTPARRPAPRKAAPRKAAPRKAAPAPRSAKQPAKRPPARRDDDSPLPGWE